MLQNLFFGRTASSERRRVVLLLMCIWMFGSASVWAQKPAGQNPAGNSGAPSIGGVLNADGAINPQMAGSFSVQGFEMKLAANGSPRFMQTDDGRKSNLAPQASCGDGWDDRFFEPGANGVVYAAVADGAGNVYIGGAFTAVGDISASRIAKWNGIKWSALGSGVSGSAPNINALATSGTDVYVGGDFTFAGGAAASRIAKWNGTSWSTLGSGVAGSVFALAVSGTDVYAVGNFSSAGGVSASRIAKWNGSNWSALDAGVSSTVESLAVSGNSIYAGGAFVTAGCRGSSRFARYFSQSFTGGGADNDWFTAANWSGGTVPATDSDANVATADVSVGSADAVIRDLRVDEGRTLTIAAGRTLTVTRSFKLLGSITGAGTVVVSNCDPAALVKEATDGYIRSTLVRCVSGGAGIYNFPVGTASGYSPVQMTNIAGTGSVSILANEGAYSGSANGLPTNRLSRWWQIENSGGGVTQTDLIFNYLQSDIAGVEASYKAYRISGGTATQVLSSVDTAANTVKATGVTQFSDWTLAQIAPTAASTMISGKVLTPKGRGLQNAAVLLTDENGITRRAISRAFGNYSFEAVATGQTYLISVVSKHYQFEPQIITVNGEITEFNLTALP